MNNIISEKKNVEQSSVIESICHKSKCLMNYRDRCMAVRPSCIRKGLEFDKLFK